MFLKENALIAAAELDNISTRFQSRSRDLLISVLSEIQRRSGYGATSLEIVRQSTCQRRSRKAEEEG